MTPCCALQRDVGGDLGLDLHALGDGDGARGLRLGLALDLDQAHAARGDRLEERVVAEARHGDAELLGGADHQRALGHGDVDAVDGHRDAVDGRGGGGRGSRGGDGHRAAAPAKTVAATGSKSSDGRRVRSREELLAEVLQCGRVRRRRGVAERAERAAGDLLADLVDRLDVGLGRRAVLEPLEQLVEPERALAARGALAARLVLVEVDPAADRAHDARGLVEHHRACRCRASCRRRPCPRR